MQYRLYENANNDTSNILKEVLKNRGIDDYHTYLDLDEGVIIPYQKWLSYITPLTITSRSKSSNLVEKYVA